MEYLPPTLLLPIVFAFGVILGSFANVIIDRMHTGKSLNDRSRCFSCGTTLTWYELVPLLSFAVLRGRCHNCRARIPGRFFLVELLMGLVFVLVVMKFGLTLIGLLSLILAFLLTVITVYDLRHFIIPNELVLSVAAASISIFLAGGQINMWWQPVAATLFLVLVYGGLWLVSSGRWLGFGDVKLVAALGPAIGLASWFSFVVWSFWTGAVISLALIAVQQLLQKGTTRLGFLPASLTMKSEVPFAPFLILAFALIYLFDLNVLDIIAYVFEVF